MPKLLVCNSCGHAHFPTTEQEVLCQAQSFKTYFDSLSSEQQQNFYRTNEYDVAQAVANQKQCFRCGNSNINFHKETSEDNIPAGVTIQGIISPFIIEEDE